jgi:uncharacterized membrane protein YfcA
MNYPELALIAFILSALFSIGGVGSAVAIVPMRGWLGTHLMHFRISSEQVKKVR